MSGKLRHITSRYPRWIPVLLGSPIAIVDRRQLVNTKEVNREIKYWATWYLLKSLTTSSCIQHWTKQKKYLLKFLQMNEGTLRSHLRWLQEKSLVEIDKETKSIRLASYPDAAEVMSIKFQGTYTIEYEYKRKEIRNGRQIAAKQSFQYILRAEEFERRKEDQLAAIIRKMDDNPKLYADIVFLLTKEGSDVNRLHTDAEYFQHRLLQLQLRYFKQGSDILSYVFSVRADINRGVKKIKEHHGYKGQQSATYLKRKMWFLGIISVQKICIVSEKRSRIYIPDEETGGDRDGYKWLIGKKETALFLTDQVAPLYDTNFGMMAESIKMTA